MRVGFTGTHGTGKTTLLRALLGLPEFNGHAFISGLTRAQSDTGVKINQNGDFESQKQLVRVMSHYVKCLPDLVIDRTLLDIYGYTRYLRDHNKLTSQNLNYIKNRAKLVQPLFDVVFHLRPEFEIQQDEYRPADPGFMLEVAAAIEHTVTNDPLSTKKIVPIYGSVETRVGTIRRWLSENQVRRQEVVSST